jgi:farnesyl-diphosphate farnesyltransferase
MDRVRARTDLEEDLDYQWRSLEGVSRTFALTIPTLPPTLAAVVGNAYLLCRIADTVEDEPGLQAADKRAFSEALVAVLEDRRSAESFAAALLPRLTASTLPAERDLVSHTARVLRITRSFNPAQRAALKRCVVVMSRGMAEFQHAAGPAGLADMPELDRYCYHVAGVVGEMLTELFCDHCPELGTHRARLQELAVSFGQGLQMTNILKDVWEDRRRGACWLPRDVFRRTGMQSLDDLAANPRDPAFQAGLRELVAIARRHLEDALDYTLLMPRHETGIRRFCLWALGMAVLTLRRIHARPDFSTGSEVKISRRSVKATVLLTSVGARSDWALRGLFGLAARGLPLAPSPAALPLA